MLPIALLFFGFGLLLLAGCAYATRVFMRAYDQRSSYIAGLRQARLVEIWPTGLGPLAAGSHLA